MGEVINVVEYEDTEDQVSYYFGCSLTLSDVGRGGQKGNKWEFFQKFSSWKVHFPRGLMDKALAFDTKGP